MKGGDLNHALRVATTGVMIGPGVFECLVILGKDETLRRIETALNLPKSARVAVLRRYFVTVLKNP